MFSQPGSRPPALQFSARPGVIYDFTGEGNVICTFFGTLWSWLLNLQFEVATTKSKTDFTNPVTDTYNGDGSINCGVTAWCAAATSPPACNPGQITQQPLIPGMKISQCANYYVGAWLAEKQTTDKYWNCIPLVPGNNETGVGDSSLGVCTKQ